MNAPYTLTTHSTIRPPRTAPLLVGGREDAARKAFADTWTRSPDLVRAQLRDPRGRVIAGGFRAALVALLAFALFGCSGAQHRSWDADAHIGINSAAHALVLEDGVLSAAAQHDTATGTTDAQLVARYQAAATQEQVTLASLVLLDHGVSLAIATGAASDRCRLVYLATHANQSIVDLRGVLIPLGQSVPADVSSAVPLLASIATAAAPSCASSGSPQP